MMMTMNVMQLVERAAELNEDGVYSLANGRFPAAVELFENAVRTMMQVCEQTTQVHQLQQQQQQQQQVPAAMDTTDSSDGDGPHYDKHSTDTATTATAHSSGTTASLRGNVEVPYLTDERFFLYSCMITFTRSCGATMAVIPSSAEIAFYCATILFNLALTHHQQAQRCSCATSLRQSLQLYQEAAKALQTLQQRLTPVTAAALACTDDDLLLMNLAIWNNQACILTALSHPEDAQHCFQQVLLQARLVLQDVNSTNFSIFEQSQIQEFARNAMVFLGTKGGGLQEPAAACA